MKKIISEKLDVKVRSYLKKNFPDMELVKYEKITDKKADAYGFNGMVVRVVNMGGNKIAYQLVTNSNR